jgi:hypothetical protein
MILKRNLLLLLGQFCFIHFPVERRPRYPKRLARFYGIAVVFGKNGIDVALFE